MSTHVCNGAVMKCSFGVAPSSLIVLPVNRVLTCGLPAATINDHVPLVNVPPFGMCQSPANPTVAAATAAASGVLTPMPCVPVLPAPWIPGSVTVLEGGIPVLNNTCQLTCMWGGLINISMPGQMTVLLDSGGASGGDAGGAGAGPNAGGLSLLDKVQLGLDAAGMIPVVQDFTDPVSAVVSAARGDWAGAGLALAGMIPVLGEGADAAKLAKDAEHAAEIAKDAEHVAEASKDAEHVAEAAEHTAQGAVLHEGKQGKHVPGHNNFQPGKSEITHPDPQSLITNGAGTGVKHGNKEVVDFGENIGTHVSKDGTRTPTTRGTIHYDQSGGAHIVPAHPNPSGGH